MKSIPEILQECTSKLVDIATASATGGLKGIVQETQTVLNTAGLEMLTVIVESMDEMIYSERKYGKEWTVVRKGDVKKIMTSLGTLEYRRRYYRNQRTGEMAYLADRWLDIEAHQRINDDVRESLVQKAVHTSYQTSGKQAAPEVISRTSVGRYVGETPLVDGMTPDGQKRTASVVYVEADEDHVAMQDGSTVQMKLIYVHEGNVSDSKRAELNHVRYFYWPLDADMDDLWEKVSTYIEEQYDGEKLQRVWLCGDGASWIESGAEWLPQCRMVLDRYHVNKAFMKLTANASCYRSWGWKILRNGSLEQMKALCDKLRENAEGTKRLTDIAKQSKYLLNHWDQIIIRRQAGAPGCSAEGHVSHVYSARLSSRPMGWGYKNVQQMAGLRVMEFNGTPIVYEKRNANPSIPYLPSIKSFAAARANIKKDIGDWNVSLPVLQYGKNSNLCQAIRGLVFGSSAV